MSQLKKKEGKSNSKVEVEIAPTRDSDLAQTTNHTCPFMTSTSFSTQVQDGVDGMIQTGFPTLQTNISDTSSFLSSSPYYENIGSNNDVLPIGFALEDQKVIEQENYNIGENNNNKDKTCNPEKNKTSTNPTYFLSNYSSSSNHQMMESLLEKPTLNDLEKRLDSLEKENFDLKLKLFFKGNHVQSTNQRRCKDHEDVIKINGNEGGRDSKKEVSINEISYNGNMYEVDEILALIDEKDNDLEMEKAENERLRQVFQEQINDLREEKELLKVDQTHLTTRLTETENHLASIILEYEKLENEFISKIEDYKIRLSETQENCLKLEEGNEKLNDKIVEIIRREDVLDDLITEKESTVQYLLENLWNCEYIIQDMLQRMHFLDNNEENPTGSDITQRQINAKDTYDVHLQLPFSLLTKGKSFDDPFDQMMVIESLKNVSDPVVKRIQGEFGKKLENTEKRGEEYDKKDQVNKISQDDFKNLGEPHCTKSEEHHHHHYQQQSLQGTQDFLCKADKNQSVNEDLLHELKTKNKHIEALEEKLTNTQAMMKNIEGKAEDVAYQQTMYINEVQEDMKEKEKELQKQCKAMRKELDKKESHILEISEKMEKTTAKNNDLLEKLKSLREKVNKQENKLENLRFMEKLVEESRQREKEYETNETILLEKMNETNAKVLHYENILQEFDSLRKECDTYKITIENADIEKKDIENQLSAYKSEIESLQESVKNEKATSSALKTSIMLLDSRINDRRIPDKYDKDLERSPAVCSNSEENGKSTGIQYMEIPRANKSFTATNSTRDDSNYFSSQRTLLYNPLERERLNQSAFAAIQLSDTMQYPTNLRQTFEGATTPDIEHIQNSTFQKKGDDDPNSLWNDDEITLPQETDNHSCLPLKYSTHNENNLNLGAHQQVKTVEVPNRNSRSEGYPQLERTKDDSFVSPKKLVEGLHDIHKTIAEKNCEESADNEDSLLDFTDLCIKSFTPITDIKVEEINSKQRHQHEKRFDPLDQKSFEKNHHFNSEEHHSQVSHKCAILNNKRIIRNFAIPPPSDPPPKSLRSKTIRPHSSSSTRTFVILTDNNSPTKENNENGGNITNILGHKTTKQNDFIAHQSQRQKSQNLLLKGEATVSSEDKVDMETKSVVSLPSTTSSTATNPTETIGSSTSRSESEDSQNDPMRPVDTETSEEPDNPLTVAMERDQLEEKNQRRINLKKNKKEYLQKHQKTSSSVSWLSYWKLNKRPKELKFLEKRNTLAKGEESVLKNTPEEKDNETASKASSFARCRPNSGEILAGWKRSYLRRSQSEQSDV